MSKQFGRGPVRSLRAKVNSDVRELLVENEALRSVRYGYFRRTARKFLVDRSVAELCVAYVASLPIILLIEWVRVCFNPKLMAVTPDASTASLLKDITGIFITTQVGMLAVVTVAVGVVTLLSQRDDGTSSSADIRLYYFESASYEVAFGGIALLIVLIAQLFWPLQILQAYIGGSWGDLWCRSFATAEHALWLILNLWLFAQFIGTTLRFVEPGARIELREKFSANEVIPEDIRRRLLQAYFQGIPSILWPSEDKRNGPLMLFSHGALSPERSMPEVAVKLHRPSRLGDIWLRPLAWALGRWRRRCIDQLTEKGMDRFGNISVPIYFETTLSQSFDLVLREGGVPFTAFERFVVRHSFRFTRADNRIDNLPDPTVIIAQLVSRLVGQIDQSQPNGFDGVLDELLRYHKFVLAAQNTRDENGQVFSLAQVGRHWLSRPVADWAREYRRAFFASAHKLSADTWFMGRMAGISARLWPDQPEKYTQAVLDEILDFGRYTVIAIEDWVVERSRAEATEQGAGGALRGSDLRAYDRALLDIVSAWETTATVVLHSFAYGAALARSDAEYWSQATASWPSLRRHLWNTAYFLAAAVWNDDPMGAEQFRDMLLRWLNPFHDELEDEFRVREATLLTPEILSLAWPEAEAEFAHDPQMAILPVSSRTAFGTVLRQTYLDVVCLTGVLFIYWSVTKQQTSSTSSRAGILTLRRERLADGGEDLSHERGGNPKSVFRMVFDVMLRQALRSSYEESSYSGQLSGLVDFLNAMSSQRMVPGRIYSGYGQDGFDMLVPEMLTVLAASLPAAGDEGVSDMIARLIENHPAFKIDRTLRDLTSVFRSYAQKLEGDADERFRATAALFEIDQGVPERRRRLKALFEALADTISAEQRKQLREAPLDPDKTNEIKDVVEGALLDAASLPAVFTGVQIKRGNRSDIETKDQSWRFIDKGCFTAPTKSTVDFREYFNFFSERAKDLLRWHVWDEFKKRPHAEISVQKNVQPSEFYALVLDEISQADIGDDLAILVPYPPLGEAISLSVLGDPAIGLSGFTVERDPSLRGGGGNAYLGSLNGIPVFRSPFSDAALVCSRLLLKSVSFGRCKSSQDIYHFDITDEGDPTQSSVHAEIAPALEWEDWSHICIKLVDEVEHEAPGVNAGT